MNSTLCGTVKHRLWTMRNELCSGRLWVWGELGLPALKVPALSLLWRMRTIFQVHIVMGWYNPCSSLRKKRFIWTLNLFSVLPVQVQVAGLYSNGLVLLCGLLFFWSGVLSSASFHVNMTNVTLQQQKGLRVGADFEEQADCNHLFLKGLSTSNQSLWCETPCLCFSLVVKCAAGFCMKDGNSTVCFKAFQLLEKCEI